MYGIPTRQLSLQHPSFHAAPVQTHEDYTLYAKPDHRIPAFCRHRIAGTRPREDQLFVSYPNSQGKRGRELGSRSIRSIKILILK